MDARRTNAAALSVVLGLCLVITPTVPGQDLGFEGLEVAAPRRPLSEGPAVSPPAGTRQEKEDLALLLETVEKALATLRRYSRDSEGASILQPSYKAYQTRQDERRHLLLVGDVFVSTAEGFSAGGDGLHDFRVARELLDSIASPVRYLRVIGARGSRTTRALVGLTAGEVERFSGLAVTGHEREWHKIPTRAWKEILTVDARLTALAHRIRLASGGPLPAAAGVIRRIDALLTFNSETLGVDRSRDQVDLERAWAAFEKTGGGSRLVSSSHRWTLKPAVRDRLDEVLGVRTSATGGDALSKLLYAVMQPLFAGIEQSTPLRVLDYSESRARAHLGPRLYHIDAQLQALKEFFEGGASYSD